MLKHFFTLQGSGADRCYLPVCTEKFVASI